MPATLPAKIIEADSVTEVVTSKGVDYEVTVSAVNRNVFDTSLFIVEVHKGRAFVIGKLASGIHFQKKVALSRFVFPGEIPENKVLDHEDQRPLNNVLSNLRVVGYDFNGINSTRKIRSKFFKGVLQFRTGKFVSYYAHKQLGTFDTARIAKTARILHARERGPEWEALETDIDMSDGEIEAAHRVLKKPKGQRRAYGTGGVSRHKHGLWQISFRSTHHGYFKTEKEALLRLERVIEEYERKLQKEDEEHNIKRDVKGIAFLKALQGEPVLLDDDVYMVMYRNKIHVAADGYPIYKGKPIHKSIITEPYNRRTHHVDHINGIKLDNRRDNLRIVPIRINAMNVAHNRPDKYPGVLTMRDGRFKAYVVNRKVTPHKRNTKIFKTAIEAYNWRTALHKKIYPEFYV